MLIATLARGTRYDALVLPLLFCYRQSVELRLKAITLVAFTDEPLERTHDLEKLWPPLRDLLRMEGFEHEEEEETLAVVDAHIKELSTATDPKGLALRYPKFADLVPLEHQIDLGNLRSVMDSLSNYLEALHAYWEDRRHVQ